ncbi:MAG: PAS domain-containing protein [Acetobacteraceae bacterium]|nr:PAS domain-containing protein [Acetobacteraceae bacterium]
MVDANETASLASETPAGDEAGAVIVAIGAAATQTGSLIRVLRELPLDHRIAVVLGVQSRELLDVDAFRRALGERGNALARVVDGAPVETGRIYLPDPDVTVTVTGGQFGVHSADQAASRRATIDSLFVTLARDQDGRTIGVVLAGTGGDGTLGVTAVKETGGLTVAEFLEGGADLSVSNGAVALADFVLPASEIAGQIAVRARVVLRHRDAAALETQAARLDTVLEGVAAILRDRTGHDFHGYKRNTFVRRIQRRMQVAGLDGFDEYIQALRTRPDEAQNLFNDLLIGVTQFFRDRPEFDFLEESIIPRLFEGKSRRDQLRVWVLGCSTGEEAYSLAILLREYAAKLDSAPQIQIFASDLDGRALASARVGRYPETIAKDLTPERLGRWFAKEGNTYAVVKELRETCVFAQHSIIKDTPFSRLDLVSCRNLLIYLDTELQDRVIPLFHFALRPGGYLFLGTSENVSRHPKLFEPVDRGHRVFRRAEGARVLPDLRFNVSDPHIGLPIMPRPRPVEQELVRRAERLADRHAPAYAIVDSDFEVQHFSARAGRFIHPAGGTPTLNLLNLVHSDLRIALRSALGRAATQGQVVRVDGLEMGLEAGERAVVDIIVEPVQDGSAGVASPHGFVVLFKDGTVLRPDTSESEPPSPQEEHARRLDAELRLTRERLQATIEALESTNEELKASNEEYQSLNEELQSANEELATSKEELQSLNEELTTVNGELGHRVEELDRVNSDLKNLLESTQIATVFLDNELRVMNFTPAAAEVYHFVETDVGRPVGHIKSRIAYEELQADVRRVLRTLGAVEREVEEPITRTRYMARVLPYRSVDNFIAGAVVTFTDITPLTRAQRALRESEARLRLVTERVPQFIWTALNGGRWTWSSRQWQEYTGQTEAESRGLGWLECVHPEDRALVAQAWEQSQPTSPLDWEFRIRAADGTYRWFHSRAAPLAYSEGEISVEWFGTSTDVHETRELQNQQAVMVAELQHRTRNLIAVVRSLADRTMSGSRSIEDFQERFRERLAALSRVQGLLSRLAPSERVTVDELIRAELAAMGVVEADGRGPQVTLDGPADVRLLSATVQTLALALHELATNALKHGAFSTPQGRLLVHWRLESDRGGRRKVMRLEWRESGVEVRANTNGPRVGYGRELIEQALPYQLGAETSYEFGPDGVRCTIIAPVAADSGKPAEE